MSNENKPGVLVMFNRLGYSIKPDQVDGVLNPSNGDELEARKWLVAFFGFEEKYFYHDLIKRYADACANMKSIHVGIVENGINDKTIEIIASAKRCYSYNECIACIEMCALFAEMFCQFLGIANLEKITPESTLAAIKEKFERIYKIISKVKNKQSVLDRLFQPERIRLLEKAKLLQNDEVKVLTDIHETRIKYFHRWSTSLEDVDKDALRCLKDMSALANKYLDLLNNTDNLKRIKAYLKNHSSQTNGSA